MSNVEELMKPRRKVIADYPGARFPVGEILHVCQSVQEADELKPQKGHSAVMNEYGQFDKYPHLFKPLEWHEDRELNEMPEYVKVNTGKTRLFLGNVLKVRFWKLNVAKNMYCSLEEDLGALADLFRYDPGTFTPATETEYNEYQKTKS